MKTSLVILFFAFLGLAGLYSQELNILYNPTFMPGPYGQKLDGWTCGQKYSILPNAGPHGENVLRIESQKGGFSQDSLPLMEGEDYRIGAWIKTVDFESRWAVFGFWNQGWTKASYTPVLPDTYGEWVKIEAVVKVPWSSNKHYAFGLTSSGWKGSLEIASPFLIPESERAKTAQQALNAPSHLISFQCFRSRARQL